MASKTLAYLLLCACSHFVASQSVIDQLAAYRANLWKSDVAAAGARTCGTLGALPCKTAPLCKTSSVGSELTLGPYGVCMTKANNLQCGLNGEPPCAAGTFLYGMELGDYFRNFAFDLGSDGCVLSQFFSDLRFVKVAGVCTPCGAKLEPKCLSGPACLAKKNEVLGRTNVVDPANSGYCKEVVASCGTRGLAPCAAGETVFPDVNADGCEDYLRAIDGLCVACESSDDDRFGVQLCGYKNVDTITVVEEVETVTTALMEYHMDCGTNGRIACPTSAERPWGCQAGFIENSDGKCVWTNCGVDVVNAQKPCEWALWPHVAAKYSSTLKNGCHPMHNVRLGVCVKCAESYRDMVPASSTSGATALRRDLLLSTSSKLASWNGSLETDLWRSRCDMHGCGFQYWSALYSFNNFDVSKATSSVYTLNPDVQICMANNWEMQPSSWKLFDFFTGKEIGVDWKLNVGAAVDASPSGNAGAPPPPRTFGSSMTPPLPTGTGARVVSGWAAAYLASAGLWAVVWLTFSW